MISERVSQQAFFGTSALLFTGSATATVLWCKSMSAMGAMPMPGGWTMSMAWMRMPGQTWATATGSFMGMWLVMMVAMMLPSLVPMLSRYRRGIGWAGNTNLGTLTAIAGSGYFLVWTLFGLAVFPLGVAASRIEMEETALARSVPMATGFILLLCGAVQFTGWKAHHLASCLRAPEHGRNLAANFRTAWQQGLRFGLHCGYSCLNLTLVLLVMGVMDLRAMALVTAAISMERLAPSGEHAERAVGAIILATGLFQTARAASLL